MTQTSLDLPSPSELALRDPISARARAHVEARRGEVAEIVAGTDSRFLLVVGPCSIHDEAAALEYAEKLGRLAERVADDVVVCMRVYLEKPRTCAGWKGFLHDPGLDGSLSVSEGLQRARRLMIAVAEHGLGIATELLDPLLAEYHSEFLAWAAIGARTSESQIHRELASSRAFSVGFKNAVDGSTTGAVHSVLAASKPHTRFGIDPTGRACLTRSAGNPSCHVVLRGGRRGPNYQREHVDAVTGQFRGHPMVPRVMIDCSHGNSGKEHRAQCGVFEDVRRQLEQGAPILGAMLESHLVEGQQAVAPLTQLVYGQSITDACIDFAATETLVEQLAEDLAHRTSNVRRTNASQLQPAAAATS
jgi:3-deoxy-7-phosphoheptulonate synthase